MNRRHLLRYSLSAGLAALLQPAFARVHTPEVRFQDWCLRLVYRSGRGQ